MIAKRLIGAGVKLLEVTSTNGNDIPIAHFPGWQVPLAAGMKAVVEVPVLVGKLSIDPALADSVIRDGSADLVGLNEALRGNPLWPQEARTTLMRADDGSAALQERLEISALADEITISGSSELAPLGRVRDAFHSPFVRVV